MKKFLILFFILPVSAFAQKERNIWYFGQNAGMDFNGGPPVALTNSAMNQLEGCASIADVNGSLLFYTDGATVWNKTHVPMPNGTGLLGHNNSAQSCIIVPKPGSTTLYYIFTTPTNGNAPMNYSIVDMSLLGGNGNVTTKNAVLFSNSTEKVTAVKHANGTDIWVIGHGYPNNTFYAYLVTNAGVGAPVTSNAGTVHNSTMGYAGYMKAAPDGKHIAYAITINQNLCELLDFNNTTGIVSNPVTCTGITEAYGIEFSPDGSKLYVTEENPKLLLQFDVNAGSAAAILASKTVVGTGATSYGFAALQLAPDGKIYMARRMNAPALGVINQPNASGTACNFVENGFSLNGKTSLYGLPNFIQGSSCTPVTAVLSPAVTICAGSTASLNASGGTAYSWSNGATTSSISVSPTVTTYYAVIVSDSCGTDKDSVAVTVNSMPVANAGTDVSVCPGSVVTLTGSSSGTAYAWAPGGQTTSSIVVVPTTNSSYTFSVSNACGTSSDSVNVKMVNTVTVSVTGPSAVCSGQPVTLVASGGVSYSWSTGATASSITVTPAAGNTYSVIASAGSCSDTAGISIPVSPSPSVNITPVMICKGSTTVLTPSLSSGTPGYSYTWSPGGQTTSAITVGPVVTSGYTVQVVDANGCSSSAATQVTVNTGPVPGITGNVVLCVGDIATLSANGGTAYTWNTGSTASSLIVAPTSTSAYTVTATDVNGCTGASTVTVTVFPPPVAIISGDDTICAGDNATLNAGGGNTYLWNTGQTLSSIVVSPALSTTYTVAVAIGSCSDTATIGVAVIPLPIANAGAGISINSGQVATLTATGGGAYLWSNGDTGAVIMVNPNSTTQYCVYVTNTGGCTDTSCLTVYVEPMSCPENIYVPNAFSPNGDNENDLFEVYFVNVLCVEEFKMVIYHRWGEPVYVTNDPAFKWNGIYKADLQGSEVFTYYMMVLFANGDQVTRRGNISLVR